MNQVRIERMLRELHAGPPLRFLEDLFALRDIVAGLLDELDVSNRIGEAAAEIAAPALASGAITR